MRLALTPALAPLCLSLCAAFAAPPPSPPTVDSASSIGLSGDWRFQPEKGKPRGSRGAANGWEAPDFDDAAWPVLKVPANWESQGYSYDGIAWYRRKVRIPASWKGSKLILRAGLPDDGAEAYLNGVSLGATLTFGDLLGFPIPAEHIRWDADNTVSIRVWDWYKGGGLGGEPGDFEIARVLPFAPTTTFQPETLALSVDRNLPAQPLDDPRWANGWRDEGTSDTRPRLKRAEGAFHGKDAVALEVWYPNASEYVDYRLGEQEDGAVWDAKGLDYLAFHVKSEVAGELQVKLNQGDIRWKKGGPSFGTRVWIEAGDWQRVVLPFEAFTQKDQPLRVLTPIDTLSLGYGNHELRGPGTLLFAGFEVGHFDIAPAGRPVSLAGLWRFARDDRRPDGSPSDFKVERDRQGYGEELGWHRPDFDDAGWSVLRVGTHWEKQGHPDYNGPAWYRQSVFVPAAWKGRPLTLRVGQPDDRGEVFWNGGLACTVEKFGPDFVATLAPEQIHYGTLNTVAVRIYDWYMGGGLIGAAFSLGPEPERIAIRWQGQDPAAEVPLDTFEFGAKVPTDRTVELVVRWIGTLTEAADLALDYRLVDCFHRTVATGTQPVRRTPEGELEAVVALTPAETRLLFFGEWVDVRGLLRAGQDPILPFTRREQKLRYAERDQLSLPGLPDTVEDTPLGKLRLVDVIQADLPPEQDPHPYKEGGVRAFWGGRRAYAPWVEGVAVKDHLGRGYREATNNQHFGYRIGRGTMKPGSMYLLRVLYPEDKTRYFAMDIKAGRNYQGVGFRTGVGPDNPVTPYPLSGQYEWSDHVVALDDVSYGYQGKRSTSSEHGFWVFFHDIGRVYSPQYDAGPAIAELRLYAIDNPEAAYLPIAYPEGQPRRVLMMDWERQPEADADDTARYARIIGLNALGPVMLKWSFNGYFENTQSYDGAPEWFGTPVHRDGFGNGNCWRILGEWLEATKTRDVALVPRLEYGGSENLPKEARVIGRDGKVDPCGRYTPWGANLLHPATWEDAKVLLDEVVGRHAAAYPNLGGILWRMRSDRVKCSYGKQDVALFCQETGREMPKGDAAALAKWAWQTMDKEYHDWWHAKRRDFHVRLRDYLRGIRPDLKLYYYNWDPDGWSLATGNNEGNTAQDWSDLYNVERSRSWYDRKIGVQRQLGDMDYVRRFVEGRHPNVNEPHKQLRPELYRDVDGIALFAPVHWHYLSNNEPYIRLFETGDGLAVCNQFHYEEKGRTNVQGDNYETSEMTPAGPRFAMAEEVLSFFHGDPNVITWTPYTIGRSFVTEHRRFAQAFLALPATRGTVVANANPDVRVRTYATEGGTLYASVAHRGFGPTAIAVALPGIPEGARVTDLVTGAEVPVHREGTGLAFEIQSPAMELHSFRIDGAGRQPAP